MDIKFSNDTFFDPLPQDREPEEITFDKPYTDKEIRRSNPPRYDERTEWLEVNNEKGHDSDVSNRYSAQNPKEIPLSVLFYRFSTFFQSPSKALLDELLLMKKHASKESLKVFHSYVEDEYDILEWNKHHLKTGSSTNIQDSIIQIIQKQFFLSALLR